MNLKKENKILLNDYKQQINEFATECIKNPFNSVLSVQLLRTQIAFMRDYCSLNYKPEYNQMLQELTTTCLEIDSYYENLTKLAEKLATIDTVDNKDPNTKSLLAEVESHWSSFWTLIEVKLRGWTI